MKSPSFFGKELNIIGSNFE